MLSKFLKYSAYGLIASIGAELIYNVYRFYKSKKLAQEVDEAELTEIFFVRQPMKTDSRLTRQIQFNSERPNHSVAILENLILSAQRTIFIAMYLFTSQPLAEALVKVHTRGVKVFVVMDHSMEHTKGTTVSKLSQAGVSVRICKKEPSCTMHHKLCLIDVPYDENFKKLLRQKPPVDATFKPPFKLPQNNGIIINGSLNWSNTGLGTSHENFLVTSNLKVCQESAVEFYSIWNDAKPFKEANLC